MLLTTSFFTAVPPLKALCYHNRGMLSSHLSGIRKPNARGEPPPEAGARHEQRLLGVGCRVEPVVTHPAPPQTRTCAMHASGSSCRAAAARYSPLACCGQGW